MPNPSAKIDLVADTQKFSSGMNQTQRVLGKVKARMEAVSRAAKILLVGQVALLGKLVQLAAKQEEEEAKLAAVLRATGGAAELSANQLKKHAAELQKLTGVGDEVIINAQAMLATFKEIKGDTFKQATVSILDMSKALGTDLKSSALQVGKALNDPILGVTALNRAGVQFTEKQKDMIKGFQESGQLQKAQAIILKELKDQFGGVAEAMGDTTSGALSKFSSAFGDLGEVIGAAVIPPFISLVKTITESLGPITDWVKENETLVKVMIGAGLTITGLLASYTLLGTGMAAITALSEFASEGIATLSTAISAAIGSTISLATTTVTLSGAMTALGIAAKATAASLLAFVTNPVVLGIAAIAAAIVALRFAIKKAREEAEEAIRATEKISEIQQRLRDPVSQKTKIDPRVNSEIKNLRELAKARQENAFRLQRLSRGPKQAPLGGRTINIDQAAAGQAAQLEFKQAKALEKQADALEKKAKAEAKAAEAQEAAGKAFRESGAKSTKELDKKLAALQLEFDVLGNSAEVTDLLTLAAAGYNAEQIESIIQIKNKIRAEEEAIVASQESADKTKASADEIKAGTERIRERREELEKEVLALKQGLTDDQIELIDLESLGVAKDEIKRITELLAKRKDLRDTSKAKDEADAVRQMLKTTKELIEDEKKRLAILVKRTDLTKEEAATALKKFKESKQGAKVTSPGSGAPAFQGVSAAFQRIADAAGSRTGKKPEEQTAKNTKDIKEESKKQTTKQQNIVTSINIMKNEIVEAINNINPKAVFA